MFRHIFVPIDVDPGSRRAIDCSVRLARNLRARVTGFHAITEFAHPGIVDELLEPPPDELQALARANVERLLEPLRRRAGRAGVPCRTIATRGGRLHEAILAMAGKLRCDLIVMASHGRRGVAKLVLGSQTQRVLERTRVPVLVLR